MMNAPAGPAVLPPPSDNVDEELQRISLTLNTIFGGVTTNSTTNWWEQSQLADAYLTRFQNTSISWLVCDRLLQEPDDTLNQAFQQQRRFFAAQTLHTKCRRDVHELPRDSLPSLRDSLLNHLRRYSHSNDTALVMRLAMTVSTLAIQMCWSTVVTDILQDASNNPIPVLFVLSTLPEECASDRLLLEQEEDRYAMREHFVLNSAGVFQFLFTIFQQNTARVFQALYIWIRYVPVQPHVIIESPLLEASVHALQSHEHLEAAADVIVEILRMYPSFHNWNMDLVRKMIPLLTQLPIEQALQSNDDDIQRAYCRIATEMGESYMSLILSPEYKQSSKLVEWVLLCSGIEDQDISGITLHFWYRMVMDLESVQPYDWRQELVDSYSPHLLKLIDVCAQKLMKYPDDFDDIPDDMIDELIRHRFYVSETVEDCCRLLGGHEVLRRLGNLLQQEGEKASQSSQNNWQGIESCLSCIVAMSEFVPADESKLLPFCFQLIPQLPRDIPPLRFTTSKMIGKYASWLATHSDYLQPLMPYLAEGLSINDCAPAAAIAIKELCECSNQSFAIAEPVLDLYQQITAKPGTLDVNDELQMLEGVCRALSRQIQDRREDGRDYLMKLATPIGHRFAAIVNDASANPKRIIPEVDRLAAVIQHLKIPSLGHGDHPMIELIRSIWDFLEAATTRFPSDNMLAEKICRLHKYSLRSLGASVYEPLLEPLMQQLVRSYEISHQSPFLYAASICLTEYGNNGAFTPKLFEMVAAMCRISFSFLRDLAEFTQYPDCVEELLYLMGRMITHCPTPLVESPLMHSLFQCAVVGMQLDHKGANKGTIKFLDNSVSFGLQLREKSQPKAQLALESVFVNEGERVVQNLIKAIMGDLPAYSNQIPEILWKFSLLCPDPLMRWINAVLDQSAVPQRAKEQLLQSLSGGLARDEFTLAVRSFESACNRERKFRKVGRAATN